MCWKADFGTSAEPSFQFLSNVSLSVSQLLAVSVTWAAGLEVASW